MPDHVFPGADSTDLTEATEISPVRARFWHRWKGRLSPRVVASRLLKQGIELLYPPQCITCETATATPHSLCVTCWNTLPLISKPYCERLGTPFQVDFGTGMLSPAAIADPPRFDRGRAVARHRDAAKSLVSRFKYGERLDLAKLMAKMMVQAGGDILADADLIVPVPMHRIRLWRRRYNQAALLANGVSAISGVPVSLDALQRVRHTRAQVGLGRSDRQKNLAGAFRVPAEYEALIAGRRVVVIDDVRTTGSTLNACAHILRKAGATRIDVLTFTLVASGDE
ncbi:MAG: amidophosphoribosyltransferase [Rhizobiales bacterium PAR1]|nr:MAG: amidophosphoribosyltransferase [Rhizobiales bacterium PAR1]